MNTIEIIFSPTGGTEKAARIISGRWNRNTVMIDLCDAKTDFSKCVIDKEDRVLVAMPSFGGRAPAVAIERLRKIAGNGARCTLVCVYGNRAYEDTLAEMEDAAKESNFKVVAAIAAVAEHSIMPQYAAGRPDAPIKSSWSSSQIKSQGKPKPQSPSPEIAPIKRRAAQDLCQSRRKAA